jgi:flagellar biosynthetic protein FliP
VSQDAVSPYLDDQISGQVAFDRGSGPILDFLLRQTRPDDLRLFYELSNRERPTRAEEVPLTVAVPAFMVSELTTAFRMGLFIFIPMILIDLLVSAVLMALGMMMVPPTLVSLPLKIGVFLMADGWHLLVQSLVRSFQ